MLLGPRQGVAASVSAGSQSRPATCGGVWA
jgi:hypothetical protein